MMISISPSLEYVERAFDAAKYGRVSDPPYLEVSIPLLSDSGVAPDGKHLMSIVFQGRDTVLRVSRGALAAPEDHQLTRATARRDQAPHPGRGRIPGPGQCAAPHHRRRPPRHRALG